MVPELQEGGSGGYPRQQGRGLSDGRAPDAGEGAGRPGTEAQENQGTVLHYYSIKRCKHGHGDDVTCSDGRGGQYVADPTEAARILAEVDDAGFTPGT